MKYLYVKFVDSSSAILNMIHAQIATPTKIRVAKIPLTNEQAKLLEPIETGFINGSKQYEEIELLCIQDEEQEAADGHTKV